MDILQACDLKKTYGTGEACVHALDGVWSCWYIQKNRRK